MRLDAQQPDVLYDRIVGIFRPMGSRFPVVVSDVLQAGTATITIVTRTDTDATKHRQIVQSNVLLLQTPSVAGWQVRKPLRYSSLAPSRRRTPTQRTSHRSVCGRWRSRGGRPPAG